VGSFLFFGLVFCDLMWSWLMLWVSHCRRPVGKSEPLPASGHGCEMQLLCAGQVRFRFDIGSWSGLVYPWVFPCHLVSSWLSSAPFPQMQWGLMRVYLEGHLIMNGEKHFVLVLLFWFLHNALCLTQWRLLIQTRSAFCFNSSLYMLISPKVGHVPNLGTFFLVRPGK
jgi:hypothetical protein